MKTYAIYNSKGELVAKVKAASIGYGADVIIMHGKDGEEVVAVISVANVSAVVEEQQ